MKEIKLKQLKMSNWRGQNHDITFNDDTTRISGVNGSGKSSIMHAFLWCITGFTDGYTKKNNNLFDNRAPLDENTPWASVEIEIEVDGIKYEIQRRAKPKFVRSKGSMTYTKSPSDSYEYYVDSIEVGATGFNNFVEHTLGVSPNMINYCLSGEFFSSLIESDKEASRKVLVDIAGEVKEEDFKGDYEVIAEAMKRYTTAEIVEQSKKKKKPLEERQLVIPNEIDRKEERLSELKAMDFSFTESEIERVKKEIETIDGLLLGNADAIKPILEHNKGIEQELANKRLSLMNGRLDYKEKQNARTSEIKAKIAEIKRYNEGVERENDKIKKDYVLLREEGWSLVKDRDGLKDDLDLLREEKDNIKSRIFTEDHCPYCGAELDPMEIEKKREEFNKTKTAKLEVIVSKGKAIKEKIEKLNERIDEIRELTKKEPILLEWQDLIPYEETLAKIEATFVPYEETDEYACLMLEIDALSKEMKEIPSNDNELLTSKKKGLIEELSELSKKLGLKDEIGKIEKEIEDLKMELRNVANSIAVLEQTIFKCKEWEQERNNLVSLRVNEKLGASKIEMFSTQKNGDVVPDCVLLNRSGVKYTSTNGADRGVINCDLQRLFLKHFNISLPIFVDEASVYDDSHLPKDSNYQMIYLFASNSDTLTIE